MRDARPDHLSPSRWISAAHKAIARQVGLALWLGGDKDMTPYQALAIHIRRNTTRHARQGLAWAALAACDTDEAYGIAADLLDGTAGAGMPAPPLDPQAVLADAAFWADIATDHERRAYAMACLARMTEEERHACVRALDRRRAA